MKKNIAIVLSGGKGTRLGGNIPKQYIEIESKPILAYSLIALQNSEIDEILIVCSDEYKNLCCEIARENNITKFIGTVEGGRERYDSVWNGLKYFNNRFMNMEIFNAEDDLVKVLIHDGARPFIKPEVINEIIKYIEKLGAAIAASPATDTIKISDENGFIVSTTDRKMTWSAQTPQGFMFNKIYDAYKNIIGKKSAESEGDNKQISITDDAMVYQLMYPEKPVKLVMAGYENIKVTTQKDLLIAEELLSMANKKV